MLNAFQVEISLPIVHITTLRFYCFVNQSQGFIINHQTMRGGSIIQFSPQKLQGKSLNFLFFRKKIKKNESELLGFNDQILKGSSSWQYSLKKNKISVSSLQKKIAQQNQNISKSVVLSTSSARDSFSESQCINKSSNVQRIKTNVQQKSHKRSLDKMADKKKRLSSENQLGKFTPSQNRYQKILKATFLIKKYPQSIFYQEKNEANTKNDKQGTLLRLEPWTIEHQPINQTIKIKIDGQNEPSKSKKFSKFKKIMLKYH